MSGLKNLNQKQIDAIMAKSESDRYFAERFGVTPSAVSKYRSRHKQKQEAAL